MPRHNHHQNDVLVWMHQLDIFTELIAQKNGQYEHELDLDVILYGRGYTGGLVGPYVRLLDYDSGEVLISEGEWSTKRRWAAAKEDGRAGFESKQSEASECEWDGNSFYVLVN